MFKPFIVSLLFIICVICTGCPFGSPYALEEQPREKVKPALLGHWVRMNQNDSVIYSIDMAKKNDLEYRIVIRGDLRSLITTWTPSKDSIAVSGFTTNVDGNLFMNILSQGQYYLVHVKQQDGVLSFLPLSDQFSVSIIRSSQFLKQLVSDYMKVNTPFYDDQTMAKGLLKATIIN